MKILLFLVLCTVTRPSYGNTTCRNRYIKHKFDVSQGYPEGRKGYIVDHICALACGGLDEVTNMQYQTKEEAKLKDKWETTKLGCKLTCNTTNSLPTRTVYNCT